MLRRLIVSSWIVAVFFVIGCGPDVGSENEAGDNDAAGEGVEVNPAKWLGPLGCTVDVLDQRMEAHEEAIDKINRLQVAQITHVMSYLLELVADQPIDDSLNFSTEATGADYFVATKDWEDSLPEHSKQLWPSEWKRVDDTDGIYVIRIKVRQQRIDGSPIQPVPPVMSREIETLLSDLQQRCDESIDSDNDPRSPKISHATVSARAFDDGDDIYIVEMRWFPPTSQ